MGGAGWSISGQSRNPAKETEVSAWLRRLLAEEPKHQFQEVRGWQGRGVTGGRADLSIAGTGARCNNTKARPWRGSGRLRPGPSPEEEDLSGGGKPKWEYDTGTGRRKYGRGQQEERTAAQICPIGMARKAGGR